MKRLPRERTGGITRARDSPEFPPAAVPTSLASRLLRARFLPVSSVAQFTSISSRSSASTSASRTAMRRAWRESSCPVVSLGPGKASQGPSGKKGGSTTVSVRECRRPAWEFHAVGTTRSSRQRPRSAMLAASLYTRHSSVLSSPLRGHRCHISLEEWAAVSAANRCWRAVACSDVKRDADARLIFLASARRVSSNGLWMSLLRIHFLMQPLV